MTRYSLSPGCLFDRPWRAGHPFRPKTCRARRLGMAALLAVLCLIIGGYAYLTDSDRVRSMAQSYLSSLVGGRVEVGSATLSIFEGLRLDDVKVYVEDDENPPSALPAGGSSAASAAADGSRPASRPRRPAASTAPSEASADSLVFSARSFIISYDPQSMLRGELQATQIVAEKPNVRLTHDVRTGTWNFVRLGRQRRDRPRVRPNHPFRPVQLPELLLRNARVEVAELRGGERSVLGYVAIDGRLTPTTLSTLAAGQAGQAGQAGAPAQALDFVLQSRGVSDAMGPLASGSVDLTTGHVTAQLGQFEFGHDIRSLLLSEPREWTDRHALAGRVNIPWLEWTPGTPGGGTGTPTTRGAGEGKGAGADKPRFTIRMALERVDLAIPLEERTSAGEAARRADARDGLQMMRRAYLVGGFRVQGSGFREERSAGTTSTIAAPAGSASGAPTQAPCSPSSPEPQTLNPEPSREPSQESAQGACLPSPTDCLGALIDPPPVQLRDVAGTFEFTQDGIAVQHINGRLEGNRFQVEGHIDGYSPDAAVGLHVSSPEGEKLEIPDSPPYVWSLPRDLKEVYDLLHPEGACRIEVDVSRPVPGAAVQTAGKVQVLNGHFVCKEFPYPLRDVAGTVTFGRNLPGKTDGKDWVRLENVHGKGVPDGPNRDATLEVNGWVGPVGPGLPEPCLDLTVHADEIRSEPALSKAFLPEIRQALSLFDAPGTGQLPQFNGAFTTHLFRKAGYHQKITFDTDIHLNDADAALVGFPYPSKHVTADVQVRDGYVDVLSAEMKRGDMSVKVSGRVTWAPDAPAPPGASTDAGQPPVATDNGGAGAAALGAALGAATTRPSPTHLTVTVRNLPVDEALLGALPPEFADWVRQMGVRALLDVDGTLRASRFDVDPAGPRSPAGEGRSAATTAPSSGPSSRPSAPPLDYDFAITLHDGSVCPRHGALVISDVGGALHLTRERLDLVEVHGKRGKATLTAKGGVTWPGEVPQLAFTASARDLLLEPALYALLPEAARKAWDELQPAGSLDADLAFATDPNAARAGQTVRIDFTRAEPGAPVAVATAAEAYVPAPPAPALSAPAPPATLAATRPSGSDLPPGFRATLRPRDLSARMRTIPYALDHVGGEIEVRPDRVTLTDVSARHGKAAFTLSGTGTLEPAPAWDLKVTGKDVDADADLHRALPAAVATVFDSLKVKGKLGFNLDHLAYRPPPVAAGADATAGAGAIAGAIAGANAGTEPEVDLHGALHFDDAGLDVGVPLSGVTGALNFGAAVRHGKLDSLDGTLDVARLRMADREVTDFRASVAKPADRPELQLGRLRGSVAGGDLAGQVSLAFPDAGPKPYSLSLVVRNADVKELAGESDQNLSGRLTASLALEGQWDKADARRGRGDVVVAGKEMYRIPLVLGMLQVTNLALPVSSPFKGGVARYSVEGQKVTFEKIELRSDNMLMSGDGTLDFATKRVRMNFVTDNPGGFQIPFLQDLWRGAQHELLRIQVRGTVQAPQVQASSMGTLWTTVDEVFRGDNAEDRKPARPRRHRDSDSDR